MCNIPCSCLVPLNNRHEHLNIRYETIHHTSCIETLLCDERLWGIDVSTLDVLFHGDYSPERSNCLEMKMNLFHCFGLLTMQIDTVNWFLSEWFERYTHQNGFFYLPNSSSRLQHRASNGHESKVSK